MSEINMKISICMCTYQGAEYIKDQLLSIYDQTRKPDEVIISDDGSSDGTVDIVKSFIDEHGLAGKWKFIVNPKNLGYLKNFYQTCERCCGDIVFFADQDDIWYPEKLSKMADAIEIDPAIKVLCCKFGLIDAEGKNVSGMMSPTHSGESEIITNISIESVFRKCEWPAMVLAFRKSWYDSWKDLTYNSSIPHDYLFCAKAAEEDGFKQLDLELAAHRLHENNTAKEENKLSVLLKKSRKLEEIEQYLILLDSFDQENVLSSVKGRNALAYKKQMMLDRQKALLSGRFLNVFTNRIKYNRNIRFKTLICDLLIVKQKI